MTAALSGPPRTTSTADLFCGFPNSFGTLGYTLSLTIELEPVKRFVHLRHFRFGTPEACMEAVGQIAAEGSFQGHRADFVDGTAFAPDELYLTVAAFSDVAPWRSDYTGQQVYYQSIRRDKEDFLTIRDYLWRWDTDWFWCSRPFGVQKPLVRRLWPRRYRRSDVYRKLVAFDRRHGLTDIVTAGGNTRPREFVVQDVEIPVERGAEFLRFFQENVGMSPVWMCPLRLRDERVWSLYPLKPGEVYVNFGFWGTVPLPAGRTDGYYNRLVEDEVAKLDGQSRCIRRRSTRGRLLPALQRRGLPRAQARLRRRGAPAWPLRKVCQRTLRRGTSERNAREWHWRRCSSHSRGPMPR